MQKNTLIDARHDNGQFEKFYETRDEVINAVETVIYDSLPVHSINGTDIIEFSSVNVDDILTALNTDARPAIAMFLAVTGRSTADVESSTGISTTYNIADTGSELPHRDHRAKPFATHIEEFLIADLPVETVLMQTRYRWELDHRRHYRKGYEKRVLDTLRDAGIPLLPDSQVAGSPDIAVPNNDDSMAIVGEIRSSNKQDWGTRIREFKSEVRDHATEHPNARIVIVLEFPEAVSDSRRREIIGTLGESVGESLDGIYTSEDLDRLVQDLREWAPNVQETLADFSGTNTTPQTTFAGVRGDSE